MTAKPEDPARVAPPCSLHDCLLSALILLRHIYWHVPRTLVADPRNVSGMLGKAIETLEIVERDMEDPVRTDDLMSALNLPTPAPEDGPVDYAAHVLRTLKDRLDLAAVKRQTHEADTVFTGWHTHRDSYVCYFLHPRFLHARALGDLQERTNLLARAYAGATADFPVLTGLVVPGATETAARLYQRLFDLPLLTIPIPSFFVPQECEVMP